MLAASNTVISRTPVRLQPASICSLSGAPVRFSLDSAGFHLLMNILDLLRAASRGDPLLIYQSNSDARSAPSTSDPSFAHAISG